MTTDYLPTTLAFITTGLNSGGAEQVLFDLVTGLDSKKYRPFIINLGSGGLIEKRLREKNVCIYNLALNKFPNPLKLCKLFKILLHHQPAIIQGWMYHGNLLAGLCARFLPFRCAVFYSIHNSVYNLNQEKIVTRLVINAAAKLARQAVAVIYCGKVSADLHQAIGYPSNNSRIIHNAVDTNKFQFNPSTRTRLRQELGLLDKTVLALIARWDKHKDHANFFASAAELNKQANNLIFLLAGRGIHHENSQLLELINKYKLSDKVLLLNEREDLAELYSAIDILVNSSSSEALPITIAEAMACERVCVATDVGDSKELIAETGLIVPAKNALDLSLAIKKILELPQPAVIELGQNARARIMQSYNLQTMLNNYQDLYSQHL